MFHVGVTGSGLLNSSPLSIVSLPQGNLGAGKKELIDGVILKSQIILSEISKAGH